MSCTVLLPGSSFWLYYSPSRRPSFSSELQKSPGYEGTGQADSRRLKLPRLYFIYFVFYTNKYLSPPTPRSHIVPSSRNSEGKNHHRGEDGFVPVTNIVLPLATRVY